MVDEQEIPRKSFLDAAESPTSGPGPGIPNGAGLKLFRDPKHFALHMVLSCIP